MRLAGVWEATGYWDFVPQQIDAETAVADINCTKTTNIADDYCEITIKLNSLWNCAPVSGPFVPDDSSPCTTENPYFSELMGKITRDQLDPETDSVVTTLSQTTGFIGEGCEDTVSTGSSNMFQLQFDGPDPKSFSIEVVNSNTGEVFPPSSNCASQTFYKVDTVPSDAPTSTVPVYDGDVPGCGCFGNVCDPPLGPGFPDPEACVFVLQSGPPYYFEGITNQSVPVCDALDADPTFQQTFGKNATPYYWWSGGQRAGPYSPNGFLPIYVFQSTCSDAFEYQDSCGAIPVTEGDAAGASLKGKPIEMLQQRYESRTNGTDNVTEGDATDGSNNIGAGYGVVDPGMCSMATYTLPKTFTKLRVTPTCASRFDDNITTGYEDSLLLYVVPGGDDDGFLCDADVAAGYTPALTSEDWIEPITGRRYMCYEFVDGGQPYSVLTMSLGNAPCDGPEPVTEPPSPSPGTSSGNTKGGGLSDFTASFAVAVVVVMMATLVPI